jgi:hypothetical protein
MDSAPSQEASNFALQRLLVQQPVQQRRRKTAYIGGTQRTPDPGMRHAEDDSERWRTPPKRFAYALPKSLLLQRLEPLSPGTGRSHF